MINHQHNMVHISCFCAELEGASTASSTVWWWGGGGGSGLAELIWAATRIFYYRVLMINIKNRRVVLYQLPLLQRSSEDDKWSLCWWTWLDRADTQPGSSPLHRLAAGSQLLPQHPWRANLQSKNSDFWFILQACNSQRNLKKSFSFISYVISVSLWFNPKFFYVAL